MYRQIKTIMQLSPSAFDERVNDCLSCGEGWRLVEVKQLSVGRAGSLYHYARLERYELEGKDKSCFNCKYCNAPDDCVPCGKCCELSEWELVWEV